MSAKTPIETLKDAWTAYIITPLVAAILAYDAAMKLSDDSAKEAAVADAKTGVTSAITNADAAKQADTAVEDAIATVSSDSTATATVTTAAAAVKAVVDAVKAVVDAATGSDTDEAKAARLVTTAGLVDAATVAVNAAASSSSPETAVSDKEEKDADLLRVWVAFIGTGLVIAIKKNSLDDVKNVKKKGSTEAATAATAVTTAAAKKGLNATVVAAVNGAVEAVQEIILVLLNSYTLFGKDDKIKNLIDKAKTEIDKVKVSSDSSSLSVDKTVAVVEVAKATGVKTLVTTLYITSKDGGFSVSEDIPSTRGSSVFKMKFNNNCWARVDDAPVTKGGAMTKKRMRTTKRQLKGKRGLKSRVKSRVKTSRS